MKPPVQAMLVSPHFLFRVEQGVEQRKSATACGR